MGGLLKVLVAISLIPILVCGASAQGSSTVAAKRVESDCTPGSRGRRPGHYALVIGNDGYNPQNWRILTQAHNDARAITKELCRHGYAVVKHEDLTTDRMRKVIADFFSNEGSQRDANIFIWFSGHGSTLTINRNEKEGYLVPIDAPPEASDEFQRRAIALSDLAKQMRALSARNVLAVFDSCFGGSVFERTRSASAMIQSTSPVRQMISSGGESEQVFDNGFFRDVFISAINGEDPSADFDKDGLITVEELGTFLYRRVSARTDRQQMPRWGRLRGTPDQGTFVFNVLPSNPANQKIEMNEQRPAAKAAPDTSVRRPAKSPGASTPREPLSVAPGSPARPEAPQAFQECPECPIMVRLRPGAFTMGSNEHADARPPQSINIVKPFAIGRFEVSVAEFEQFVRATGHPVADRCWKPSATGDYELQPGSFRASGARRLAGQPAACVSWADAKAYVAWLRERTKQPYRLPTEAEWEYAARAGSDRRFHFGDDEAGLCAYANHADASSPVSAQNSKCKDENVASELPATAYKANPFGLHNIIGNLEEWVEDCYGTGPDPAVAIGGARRRSFCPEAVLRGGSWHSTPDRLTSAFRNRLSPSGRFNDIGFRVARDL